ncbi:MAG: hypothetical protein COA99_01850, partial [Moraxellaceae bacterium]
MSQNNKVVWSEGMFLRPQHFQQQDRYLERYVDARCNAVDSYGWGFQDLVIDQDLLNVGKISLTSASGVLPDGTPFHLPQSDQAPNIIDIPENVHNEMIYLALPLHRAGALDVSMGDNPQGLARYHAAEANVRDAADSSGDLQQIQLGALQLTLLRESEDLSGYACLGVCRIVESREDKQIILDDQLRLGNLNDEYLNLFRNISEYQLFRKLNPQFLQIGINKNRTKNLDKILLNLKRQKELLKQELGLMRGDYERMQTLFEEGAVAKIEVEQKEMEWLGLKSQVEALNSSILNAELQQQVISKENSTLAIEQSDRYLQLRNNILSSYSRLLFLL